MRWLSFVFPLLLVACGPGAIDTRPSPPDQARLSPQGDVLIANESTIVGPLEGAWSCEGGCIVGGANEQAQFVGEVMGTATSRGDADRGVVRWVGVVPPRTTAIAIPIVNGPVATANTITAEVGGRRVSMRPVPGEWRYWRVRVRSKAEPQRLTVTLQDDGVAWGQWIAGGTPQSIRR